MKELTTNEKQELLDQFGKRVIEHVRDTSLNISMNIATGKTVNPILRKQYSGLSKLSDKEKELVCDLPSKTITSTIYNFLDMFEAYPDEMKLYISNSSGEHNMCDVSEKMGGEIAFEDEDGWIPKFSTVGRFIM